MPAATASVSKIKYRKQHTFTVGDVFIWALMLLVMLTVLYPVLRIVAGSFSNSELLTRNMVGIIPKGFTVNNYVVLFQEPKLWLSYWNTIVYTVVGTLFNVLLTLSVAYPLSKRTFVGRRKWNFLLMFTMLFSGGLIPTFVLVAQGLQWMNTIWAVTVPGVVGAWTVILARTFFESIPKELEESAKIDGANDLQILMKIFAPLAMPIIATLSLYAAVGMWNNYLTPLLYMQNPNKYPLALLLRQWLTVDDASSTNQNAQQISQIARNYTAIVVTTLPIVCVYPFIQKYFAKGMMVGAIKG